MRIIQKLQRWFWKLFALPKIETIRIAQDVLEDLCSMAQTAHPKECLVFFAATKGIRAGILHIDQLQLQAYDASDDSAHVWLSNIPMTTSIVGTAHSHPGGSTRPSDADLHFFSKFGFVHGILGEPYQPHTIRFCDKRGMPLHVQIVTGTIDKSGTINRS